MKKKILYYAIKYNGDYNKIKNALKNNEFYREIKTKDNYIVIGDDNYPKALLKLKKPPFILFYIGDIKLLNTACIGVVGSRYPNEYGKKYTKLIVENLVSKYTIVSGVALGIDAIAHINCFDKGKTIGVLGCGINYVYPIANKKIYDEIRRNHLLISEYPNLVRPKPYYFPFRNRIIAALSKSIIVTQAKVKSGTMLTVNEALELNKDIYTIPHSIDDKCGQGCNYLIQQGANLILFEEIANLCNNI